MLQPANRLVLLSAGVFTLSFFLPAFTITSGRTHESEDIPGYKALFIALTPFANNEAKHAGAIPPFICAFANVAWLLAVFLYFTAGPSRALAMLFLAIPLASIYIFGGMRFGYYVWIGSMVMLAAACVLKLQAAHLKDDR
ncbi:hypothetical protein [Lacipirellula parvula]|uniref:Uncharacterized protein n=1 Tax=Lacipirellula parvula TaxID=2650471 RepID=A0A5K7XCF1_9BACT|nr:hypothetical protein [Lacipirellula parvula]BBO32521.1 hypothetical protein PLANPX_2133 [Lacipirellula parvula]